MIPFPFSARHNGRLAPRNVVKKEGSPNGIGPVNTTRERTRRLRQMARRAALAAAITLAACSSGGGMDATTMTDAGGP